ncbi:MAG: hypothetical protein K9M08_09965 [Pirellula sp.]|nr:hypothetical protein [Pirellula sp.]
MKRIFTGTPWGLRVEYVDATTGESLFVVYKPWFVAVEESGELPQDSLRAIVGRQKPEVLRVDIAA